MQIKKNRFVRLTFTAIFFVLSAVSFSVKAQIVTEEDLLVVELKDGSVHTIQLSGKPYVSFDGVNLSIHSANGSFSKEYNNVGNFYFQAVNKPLSPSGGSDNNGVSKTFIVETDFSEHRPTAIQTNESVRNVLSFRFVDGENVVIGGVDDATSISVYGANGARVGAAIDRNADNVNVSLSGLQPGIYIINVGTETFKVRVK